MAWTTYLLVRDRAPKRFVDDNWGQTEIEKRITRGDADLATRLTRLYGSALVVGWGSSPPPLIGILAADQAVVHCLTDAHGESQMEEGAPGAIVQARIDLALEELGSGKRILVDSAGAAVTPPKTYESEEHATFGSTTQGQEPEFSLGRKALDADQPGTLDAY